MPHIQQLAPHVADLIAAGEVVERPASVVKELVENAIDAGATAIVTEIRRGGMGMIRVTDNGCGIAPEELPTAFLRHATSKMRSAEDLGKIGTLGFRGEALAAISAVSRLDILSRRSGAQSGAALHLEGGVPGDVRECGAPEGTTITVSDLFYNTPARLKFMKKDSAETAAVAGLMQHLALSHPNISFKFIKDGQDALHTPGDGKTESAVYAALGRDFARSLVAVEGCGGEVEVKGFVTAPLMGRGSRSMQVFFVNGRFIKSQLLTAALEEGYRNQIMKGKFPGCVLFVTLPAELVDVNVHPAKTQVKFAREKEVFDAVYHTVMDCLDGRGRPAEPAKPVEQTVNPRGDFFRTMDAKTYREEAAKPAVQSTPAAPKKPVWDTEWKKTAAVADVVQRPAGYQAFRPLEKPAGAAFGKPPASVTERKEEATAAKQPSAPGLKPEREEVPRPAPMREEKPFVPAIPQEKLDLPEQQTIEPQKEAPWRIAGEVLNTYIVCESEDGCIYLIDKHAAHERVNFDRLKAAAEPPMRQTLLAPIVAELPREDGALLLENAVLLEQFGFACEDFGDNAVLVREVPADIDAADTVSTLEEFAENLRGGRDLNEKRENLLHTMACKAAIKGGWVSDRKELEVLVEKVQRGEVKYCPHGRPVAVKLTRYELEKMFKRA
ncbi:MAG: DNA mismatch repair endonuclease MutL [Ruminococcaceae bacterium]|nr:DNA mismatch repair endonuclease MutL [Oscillospiraceae bacterium]